MRRPRILRALLLLAIGGLWTATILLTPNDVSGVVICGAVGGFTGMFGSTLWRRLGR